MKTEMRMPQMGESITEATVLRWRKKPGERVEKDETILEISTDKVDSEIPAPATGILVEILAEEGKVVPVKSVIAIISDEGGASEPRTAQAAEPRPAPQAAPASVLVEPEAEERSDRFYSPLVRNIAAQYGISDYELDSIEGSGAHGRVTKADVMAYIERRNNRPAGPAVTVEPAPREEPRQPAPVPARTAQPTPMADNVRIEPLDHVRKRIAEHMVRSKATSPHVYTIAEVDVTNVSKWRQANQNAFVEREGFRLSFTPFFLEAAVKALISFPTVNASLDGDNLIVKRDINLGCAVALGTTGLVVPVIRRADQLTLAGLARSLNDVAVRARGKKLSPDDLQGGTFTVTNLGTFGSIIGCPIINQPQLAILGIGAIKKRPVVIDDMIAIREMAYLTLSYDHRVIDGSLGGQFLQHIVKHVETWDMNRQVF